MASEMIAVLREFPQLFTTTGKLIMSVITPIIDTNTHAKKNGYLTSVITIFSLFFPSYMITLQIAVCSGRQAVGNAAEDCHRVETMLAGNLRLL